jgi:hypothetical protein
MVANALSCSCDCHAPGADLSDPAACSCCPASGHWAETCEGQGLTVGGHLRCTPGRCYEEDPEPRRSHAEYLADLGDYRRDEMKDPDWGKP